MSATQRRRRHLFTPKQIAENLALQTRTCNPLPGIAVIGKSCNKLRAQVIVSIDWGYHEPLERVPVFIPPIYYDAPGIEQTLKDSLFDAAVAMEIAFNTRILGHKPHGSE